MNNNYELRPNFECLLVGRQLSNNQYETTLSHQLGKYLNLFQRLCNLCIDCRERKTVRWDLPNIFQLQLSWVMEFTRLNDQTIKLIALSDDMTKDRVFTDFTKRIGQTYQRYCSNRISLSEKSRSFKAYTFIIQMRDLLKDSQHIELLSFLKEIIEEEIEKVFIPDSSPKNENKDLSPTANQITITKPKAYHQRILIVTKPPPPKKELGVQTLTQFLENTNRDDCLLYDRNYIKLLAFQSKNREVLQKRLLDDCIQRNQEIFHSVGSWIKDNSPTNKNTSQKMNLQKVVLPTLYETNRTKLKDPQPTSTRIRSQNDMITESIPRSLKIISERSQSLAPSQQRNLSQIIETDPESQPHRLKLIRQRLRPFEIYYDRLKNSINKQSSSQIF